ncbi:hypothetical protein G6F37_007354 [Rhizopus arrhizus]|nr:hypothetical protein G6F38_007508 [Rhizopus arrhizus]KAG1156724.1 hypothetical protein G6F37_007354 [Rhizopus arrhizus]
MTTSTISRTWRRITIQIQYLPHWYRASHGKTVAFYTVDSIFYTHSAAEYDRTSSQRMFAIDDDDCSSCTIARVPTRDHEKVRLMLIWKPDSSINFAVTFKIHISILPLSPNHIFPQDECELSCS